MTESANYSAQQLRFQLFAESNGNALAVVDPNGIHWNRRQIAAKAALLSQALRHHGHLPGSIMALAAPNGIDFIIAYLAATQIGMYVVPINWHLAAPEIQYILEDSKASVLVAHSRLQPVMEVVLSRISSQPRCCISVGGAISGFSSVDSYTSPFDSKSISVPVQGRVLSYTSATTGKPKGVKLPLEDADRMLDLSIHSRTSAGTLPEEHVLLCASMLYHGAPLEGVIVALHMGHCVVLMDRLEPEAILRAIDESKATMAYIVPSMFARLLALSAATCKKYSTLTLRKVLHVGAPCPIEVKRRMIEWWGPILWEVYGATEGSGTIVGSEDWLRFPGTVGKPIAGTRLRIVGENGQDLATGAIGTIYLTRYSGDRFEYLNDLEKTRSSHLGEFFTVGDLGYLNSDGFLFLCGRAIDVINISGAKVYPAELENLISNYHEVGDCAVIGVPDARFGEAILVVIRPAQPQADRNNLKRNLVRWLMTQVSASKMPRYFEFSEVLPRDVTGKMHKNKLRERYSVLVGDNGLQLSEPTPGTPA